jgi:hypothetical protein
MRQVVAVTVTVAVTGIFGANPVVAGSNPFVVVVANGPFAGTHEPPSDAVICFHSAKQRVYTAAWKDFSPKTAKSISEVGIEVSNPDAAGAKLGDVRITFGDRDAHPTSYQFSQQLVSLAFSGRHGDIAFQGTTKDGIRIRLSVTCSDTSEM